MTQTSSTPVPVVRQAVAADAEALARIAADTFVETFGHLYPPEDLRDFLSTAYSFEKCHSHVTDPGKRVWLATVEGEVAGFIVVGRCKLPVENLEPTAGEVQQLYVYAKYQNLRLGTRLMDTAMDWLISSGHTPLYVGVWSENFGAQRLYGRYGFKRFGEYGFPVGKTIDLEFILKR